MIDKKAKEINIGPEKKSDLVRLVAGLLNDNRHGL